MINNIKKYKVGLYKIQNKYIKMLEERLNFLIDSQKDIFELININNFEIDNNLREEASVMLIDINEPITNEIREYAKKNFMQIVRITDRPIFVVTSDDIVLSFSLENINRENILLNELDNIT